MNFNDADDLFSEQDLDEGHVPSSFVVNDNNSFRHNERVSHGATFSRPYEENQYHHTSYNNLPINEENSFDEVLEKRDHKAIMENLKA